jgi:hypothetical protein
MNINDATTAISRIATTAVVTYTDQQKVGGKFVTTPGATVEGEVTIVGGGAVSVDDPFTGRMLTMIALGMVESIVPVEATR